ncbi:winged helix-turn-helix domain-containing protein [Ancylomarina longa]|uniref:ArsR family transcriptional regulator n=1 Tax=Ancylomarina longa TaxID=2487017 RepID=A0A434ATJ1_9BACT|nr:winged helix-turn-helix domain-containing protein [Ancylomarina longa]RUT77669.1 ArsR family transcriptional regulator [Ancylomarina longa]
MEVEKGKTAKYRKEKNPVAKEVMENLKNFTKTKKRLMDALKEGDKTVPQLAEALSIPADEVLYQVMSLLKYGFVETGDIDDMDEYFYYKIKDNGKD